MTLIHILKVKNFIKENQENLFVKVLEEFNEKTWDKELVNGPFLRRKADDFLDERANHCYEYEDNEFVGYKIYNIFYLIIVAIKKGG